MKNMSFKSTPGKSASEVREIAANIRMLLMDVDGVLTDGKVFGIPDHTGAIVETKGFDTQDGIALQWLSWKGLVTGVISGRVSPAVVERAKQCNMTYVYQGHIEKIPILEEILERSGIAASQVAYMGDDLTDVVVMNRVGLSIAPANARPEVKQCVQHITEKPGGYGAVREVCELLLKSQGHWDDLLRKYEIMAPAAAEIQK
jgi:3-deoxy-D-manno-octulosonate 8-phosphate phosphatase (KDO 8-P phosphatase)